MSQSRPLIRALCSWEGSCIGRRSYASASSTAGHADPSQTLNPNGKGKEKAFDPVIFSGIQPTGIPHVSSPEFVTDCTGFGEVTSLKSKPDEDQLGNYLGFFAPYLELQRTSPAGTPLFLSIVGLHAITLPQDPKQLVEDRRNMLAALLACGVDPERTCLFFQEDVPEHAELAWYLNTIAPVGLLRRMTTWKSRIAVSQNADEKEVSEANLRLGLLAYPVLQAADILLYKSTIIPVGEDQAQHLELSRTLAESFNRQFTPASPLFPIPETRIVPSKRILSLREPGQKMSKSAPDPRSRISLTDTSEEIHKNFKGAVTDSLPGISFHMDKRRGLSNLLMIWSACDPEGRSVEDLTKMASTEAWGNARLKSTVADVVVEKVEPIRREFERIRGEEGYLRGVAAKGRDKAREVAGKTMDEVRSVVGLASI